jgi:Cd2+/Zn2+-exporting ATPase/Cu+-exporting ATPase
MLASIGLAAQKGLLIKGGKYIELLARADIVLIDKTGTLTLGKPQITDIIPLNGVPDGEVLRLAASAERYSEHPLAEAVRNAAQQQNIMLVEPSHFEAMPGIGVRAQIENRQITVSSRRLISSAVPNLQADQLEAQGNTLLYVTCGDDLIGILAAADTFRSEVPEAIGKLHAIGIKQIELLTGDNERTAVALGKRIGIAHRASLLPEDKIRIVKEYQAQGHIVVMIGDGVNDAPALAQANVGIAMGAAGTDIAIEAAHIALMREDWLLVPEAFYIARRTMRVVKMNLAFTAFYNIIGLTLAAFGILPPIWAAAAQSLPDLGILGNSARLLRDK